MTDSRQYRIPTSLQRHVGESIASDDEINAMARRAYREGVFVFTRRMVDQMKPCERAIVEDLAKNFHEPHRPGSARHGTARPGAAGQGSVRTDKGSGR